MQVTAQNPASQVKKEVLASDLCRLMYHVRITLAFAQFTMLEEPERKPRRIVEEAGKLANSLSHFEEAMQRYMAPKQGGRWLTQELTKEKLIDIATIDELLTRIGFEEKDSIYEEFFTMVTKLIDTIFHAQEHRKNIHFSKFKGLIELIYEELRRDVNREPGQVWWRNNQIWLATGAPATKQEECTTQL